MEPLLFFISGIILAVCGIFALLSGITFAGKQKASDILTAILLICGIVFAVAAFVMPMTDTDPHSDRSAVMVFAFTYSVLTLGYTAIYRLFFNQKTDKRNKLILGFSIVIAVFTLLSAFILFVYTGIGILLMLPKY